MSKRIAEILARAFERPEENVSLHWAVPDFEKDLGEEFRVRARQGDRLLDFSDGLLWMASPGELPPLELAWTRSSWRNLQVLNFASIGQAAKFLEPLASRWAGTSWTAHRRAGLIQEKLRGYPKLWRDFRESLPADESFGAFSLLDEANLVYSADVTPRLPLGGPNFEEDKSKPSRAYRKLWEAFHRFGQMPHSKAKCFELGASPGGWTAVLRSLDAEVWATDRAELAPDLMKDPMVHFQKGDGFQWNPERLPGMDWVFSDVICYPERLWEWVQPWMASKNPPQMLCTLKFQGETDFESLQKFAAVPGSQLVHLFQNKHELTWYYRPGS